MIPNIKCCMPLRLKPDVLPLHHNPIPLLSTRLASTAPSPQPVSSPKPIRKRSLRIVTPVEKAYNARKKAHGNRRKPLRPIQIDAYTQKIIDARTAAIKARQQAARLAQQAKEDDSPIHGKGKTPFVESLAIGMPAEKVFILDEDDVPSRAPGIVSTELKNDQEILASENTGVAQPDHIAYNLTFGDLQKYGKSSSALSAPIPSPERATADPDLEARRTAQHAIDHATRMAAMARILGVETQSSPQRSKINTRRIIDEFGRHRTDHTIDPRQRIRQPYHDDEWTPKERIGPDTGSSEVQIGLLTAKIQLLAKEFEGRSRNDKFNKRNLRLLLHRRQRLLRYFYKRDRAGERWQHMVEKLGITDAMWKGEIEVR